MHPEFLTGEVFTVKAHHFYYHFGDKYFEGKGFLDLVGHYLPPDISFVRNSGCTQIGQMKVENDWLKKILAKSTSDRCQFIDRSFQNISINRQCELLSVSKGRLYYEPVGIDPYY